MIPGVPRDGIGDYASPRRDIPPIFVRGHLVHLCPPLVAAWCNRRWQHQRGTLRRAERVAGGTHASPRRHRRWCWMRGPATTATAMPTAATRTGCWRAAPAAQGTAGVLEHVAHALPGAYQGRQEHHGTEQQHEGQLNESLTTATAAVRWGHGGVHRHRVSTTKQRRRVRAAKARIR